MSKGVGFRPKLLPPRGRRLQPSRRPLITCVIVSTCVAVLVLVVFGLTAYNIYNNRFGRNQHDYFVGDMVSMLQVSEDLSSTFCDAYSVETFNKTSFYLLPGRARLDPVFRHNFSFSLTMKAGDGPAFVYRAHHLLANSTASLRACRDLPDLESHDRVGVFTEFLVISGHDDFRNWRKFFKEKHVRHRVRIPSNASCGSIPSSLPQLTFTVQHPSNYYFVLLQQHHEMHKHQILHGEVILSCNISATRYNVSSAVSVCSSAQGSCRFPLTWNSHEDVVAWVTGKSDPADASVSFVTDCVERVAFWVPVFGVLPVVIVILTSVGCGYILVINRSLESRYQRRQDEDSDSHTSYGSFSQEESPLIRPETPSAVMSDDDGCASIQD